jgi:acetyl-CoA carboxylase/biotin carboxylase 1
MGLPVHGSQKNGTPSSNAAKYNLPSHFIGGNHLRVAPPSKVKDFVADMGGHTVITNVSTSSQRRSRPDGQ